MALILAKKTRANVQMMHVIRKNIDSNNEQLEKNNQLAEMKFEEILQKYKAGGNTNCAFNYIIKEEITRNCKFFIIFFKM